jgi:phage terminase large subunit-like protein
MVFETPKTFDIDEEEGWLYSNPGLDVFRSRKDLRNQSLTATRVPESEARFRNLNLNQRIALQGLWLSPNAWKLCSKEPDFSVFQNTQVSIGIDLSMRTDLTAAVFAAKDDYGIVHLYPLVFAPAIGVEQRELRDKVPYQFWAKEEKMFLVPGSIIEYEWVAEYLYKFVIENGIYVTHVCFDRWRIDLLHREFDKLNLFSDAEWTPVGQGYKDMSPRIELFESMVLAERIQHGAHPLFNMAVGAAIAVRDPSNNRKLEKVKSSQRIDPLVAAVMAVHGLELNEFIDVDAWIA